MESPLQTIERLQQQVRDLEAQLAAAQQGVPDEEPAAWVATFKPEGLLALHSVAGANLEELKRSVPSNSVFHPLYTHPTTQGLDAQIIQALSAGMSIEQWQSSVDVRIGSSDLLGRAIASGEETRIELVRRAVSEVFAAQAKQAGV